MMRKRWNSYVLCLIQKLYVFLMEKNANCKIKRSLELMIKKKKRKMEKKMGTLMEKKTKVEKKMGMVMEKKMKVEKKMGILMEKKKKVEKKMGILMEKKRKVEKMMKAKPKLPAEVAQVDFYPSQFLYYSLF